MTLMQAVGLLILMIFSVGLGYVIQKVELEARAEAQRASRSKKYNTTSTMQALDENELIAAIMNGNIDTTPADDEYDLDV